MDDSSSELDDDDDFEDREGPCKMPRLDPIVSSPKERNPSVCDETSTLSELDCFIPDLVNIADNNSKNAVDTNCILIDDDDDLPEL